MNRSPSTCPWCGSVRIRRAHPHAIAEALARMLGLKVYHCGECVGRFMLAGRLHEPVRSPQDPPVPRGRSVERRDARQRRKRRIRLIQTIALVAFMGIMVGLLLVRSR